MTTIGDISPVSQRRIPYLQGRHGIFSVLWTWLFRLGSFGPGFLSSRAFRPGHYAGIDDAAPGFMARAAASLAGQAICRYGSLMTGAVPGRSARGRMPPAAARSCPRPPCSDLCGCAGHAQPQGQGGQPDRFGASGGLSGDVDAERGVGDEHAQSSTDQRLVAKTRTSSRAISSSAHSSAAASITCSQLSSTSSSCRRASTRADVASWPGLASLGHWWD
jgi:hypothetical protein